MDCSCNYFLYVHALAPAKMTSKYSSHEEQQALLSESQFSTKHQRRVGETKAAEHQEFITMETPFTSNDVNDDQAAEFASLQAEPKTNISTYTTSGLK